MKLVKKASGKQTIKLSKSEWISIGTKAGWIKEAGKKPAFLDDDKDDDKDDKDSDKGKDDKDNEGKDDKDDDKKDDKKDGKKDGKKSKAV